MDEFNVRKIGLETSITIDEEYFVEDSVRFIMHNHSSAILHSSVDSDDGTFEFDLNISIDNNGEHGVAFKYNEETEMIDIIINDSYLNASDMIWPLISNKIEIAEVDDRMLVIDLVIEFVNNSRGDRLVTVTYYTKKH